MKLLTLLFATATVAVAQDTPDFTRPLPAKPPVPIRWVVEFTYPPATADSIHRILRTTVDHTNETTRVVELDAKGAPNERWYSQGFEISRVPELVEPIITPPENPPSPYTADYSRIFFPQLSWVGQNTFVGKEKKLGQDAFVFETSFGTASKQRAYVSVSNLLPIAVENPSFTVRFTFVAAEPVELPEGFKEALDKYRSQLRAAMMPAGANSR